MEKLTRSAFTGAISKHDPVVTKKAIAAGADITTRERNGNTLPYHCAQYGKVGEFAALHAAVLNLIEPAKKISYIHLMFAGEGSSWHLNQQQ